MRLLAEKGFRPIGLDSSEGMLREARTRAPAVRLVRGDLARLPFRPGTFEEILCVNTLWTLEEAGPVLAELARVLSGRLLFDWRNRSNPGISLRRGSDPANRRAFHAVPRGRLAAWIREAGLRVVSRTAVFRPFSRGFLGALVSRIPGWAPHELIEVVQNVP